MFNGDSWEDKEKKGELGSWLAQLALSRTGVLGAADPLYQAFSGLRYERDLTALETGAHLGFFLNNGLQPILTSFSGRNSTRPPNLANFLSSAETEPQVFLTAPGGCEAGEEISYHDESERFIKHKEKPNATQTRKRTAITPKESVS